MRHEALCVNPATGSSQPASNTRETHLPLRADDELRVDQAEHVDRVSQVCVEDPPGRVEKLEELGVTNSVDHRRAATFRDDDVPAAENGELLGDRRRRDADRVLHLPDAQRPTSEQLEDPNAHRMGQALEELGLELAEALGVVRPSITIHARKRM
jgi:hypothetical protein